MKVRQNLTKWFQNTNFQVRIFFFFVSFRIIRIASNETVRRKKVAKIPHVNPNCSPVISMFHSLEGFFKVPPACVSGFFCQKYQLYSSQISLMWIISDI